MMRRYNNRRNEGRDSGMPNYLASFVMVKSKDVVCGFCKHRFYIGKELKGHNSPLLLPCGHASCSTCESIRPSAPCPQCPHMSGVIAVEKRQRLPHNFYVIGLLHALSSMPLHAIEEPDFSFHIPPNALARQQFERGPCQECGMIPYCECKGCHALFCQLCFRQLHKKTLKDHEVILLNKSSYELPVSMYCPNHNDGENYAEYYCEDCDFEGCSHCILKLHKEHKAYLVAEMSNNAMPELEAALEKVNETWRRIRQTKKDLTRKMVSFEAANLYEETELRLSQHFVYLHGVLQNLEQQLKERLRRERDALKANVDAFRDELTNQEDKLTLAYGMALTAKENPLKINMKKLTEDLLDFADSPCHLMAYGNREDKISMHIDHNWIEGLKMNHIQLHVPENPRFTLLKTNELPDDYEPDFIESDENLNTSIRASFRRDSPSPLPSIASCISSPANQSFEEPIASAAVPSEPSSLPGVGKSERVRITCFNDPTDFYVMKKCSERQFEDIEKLIEKTVESSVEPPSVVNLNSLYIVQSSMDQKWHRGRVTRKEKSNDQMLYDIYYIDLGLRDYNVSVDRMRKLVTGVNMVPGLAINCSLDEIVPVDGADWDEDNIRQFNDIVAGQILILTVLRCDPIKPIVDLKLSNGAQETGLRELLLVTKKGKINSFHKLKRINPLSAHQFYYEDLPMEDRYVKVRVLNVVSPNCIYVQHANEKAFAQKMKQFQVDYGHALKNENLCIKTPEFGDSVALEQDLNYYRGYITNIIHRTGKLEVFLVDTGETKTVKYSHVTRLPHRFREWTARAIKVSLVDIEPAEGGTYPEKVIHYLRRHLTEKTVKILPISKSGNAYGVAMLTLNETNVNANLVSIKYAVSTGQYSKHATLNNDIRAPVKPRKKQKYKSKVSKEASSGSLSFRDEQLMAQSERRKSPSKRAEEVDPFRVRVMMHKVVSPDEIYVSEATNVAAFESMSEQMQKFYSENRAECRQEDLDADLYYCIYSRKDKQYCRAMFLGMSATRPSKAIMSLIDLAEIAEVDVHEIQPLNRRFLDVPKNMFTIKLAGVSPCGDRKTWPTSSCRKLKEIIEDNGCDAKYYITLAGSAEADEIIPVDLVIRRNVIVGPTEPNRRENVSVKRRLIDEGLAYPIRGYDDNKEKELAVELKKKLKLDSSLLDTSIFVDNVAEVSKSNLTPIEEEALMLDGEGDLETNSKNDEETKNDFKEIEEEEEDEEEGEEKDSETEAPEDDKDEKVDEDTSGDDLTYLPPKIQNWIPAAHLIQDELIAKVTYVGYDGEVYFHPDAKEYYDTLDYIKETLDEQYREKTIKKYDTTWEAGDLCIAKFHADKKWYRGKVIDVESKHKTVTVIFVDYGNVEDCQIGSLKKRIALTEIPIQVTSAAIAGLKPVNEKWADTDLDVIHTVLVDKKVKVKILDKPPKPWKAAFWIIDGNTTYSVPWYIKNKTQVNCIIEDVITHEVADNEEVLSNESMKNDSTNQAAADKSDVKFIISVTDNDSDDSSEYGSLGRNSKEAADDSDHDDSDTIMNAGDLECENTVQMNRSNLSNGTESSSSSSDSGRRRRSASVDSSDTIISPNISGDLPNGNAEDHNGNEEKLLSGNSIYLANDFDINFDLQSIRSEALNSELNFPLVASTPLDTSLLTTDDLDFGLKDIDFFAYKVRDFQMSIGLAFSATTMCGYVVDSSNEDLNACVEKKKVMQEEIQLYAEQQPLLVLREGAIGIAKYSDEQWYRAQILKMLKTGVRVEFVDFGNRMTLQDGTKIRSAKKEWLEVPRLSFNFKFHNVRVPFGRNNEAIEAMTELFLEPQVFTASIKVYDPVLGIELYFDKDCNELVYSALIKDGLLEVIDPEVD